MVLLVTCHSANVGIAIAQSSTAISVLTTVCDKTTDTAVDHDR